MLNCVDVCVCVHEVSLYLRYIKESADLARRSHNTGPEWILHCWDNADNHIMDPFCPQKASTYMFTSLILLI